MKIPHVTALVYHVSWDNTKELRGRAIAVRKPSSLEYLEE
jgi:hypothetical protein